jgi:hypothetical protein
MAVLVGFTLKTHTIDDDKDHDTGIFVEVRDINGSTIALIGDAETSDDDSKHYNNGETHQFGFKPIEPDIPKEQCLPCSWKMGIKANGDDTWTFDAWLYVVFSDDTSVFGDKLGQKLISSDSQEIDDEFSYTGKIAG